jgi:predicted O-methyltransferase YrrM
MNSVLKNILSTHQVSDGNDLLPLRSQVAQKQGDLLATVIAKIRPKTSLEVGFAYGISTLYIGDALDRLHQPVRHIAIDPFQSTHWRSIGSRNVASAGFDKFVQLIEEKSEIALPQLLAAETTLDFALIDGWHTFDHALVDFFYINKMLRVGGVVVLDDASYASISKLVDHILTYDCYRVFALPASPIPWVSPKAFLLVRKLAYYAGLKKTQWPRAVALEKIEPDSRRHDWFKKF